jgi:DNA-binding LytR/AlgR family response regulator
LKLRALLVDNEYPVRKELSYLLQHFEDVQVVGEAANASEALKLISDRDYTVIFLDIAMPGLNGNELAYRLREKLDSPTIIFTTASEEYAFAFAVNSLDFLLKPISAEHLKKVLEKVRQLKGSLTAPKNNPTPNEAITPSPKPLHIVPVEHEGRILLLRQNEIFFIYTDRDKVYIKTQKNSYPTNFALCELESRLSSNLFFRCSRCYLVNLQHIRGLIPFLNGTYSIMVDDDEQSEIPMSRSKSRILKEMLGIHNRIFKLSSTKSSTK